MNENDHIVAVDIGGTKTIVSLIDRDAETIVRKRSVTETRDSRSLLSQTICLIEEIIGHVEGSGSRIMGIGVGIAGLVNFSKGTVTYAPNLPLRNAPVRKPLSDHFKLPVFVDNDANVAALGEKYYGAASNVQSFVCLTLGTGVGGGIFIEDKIYRGATGSAGELGHMVINIDGPECSCGNFGCVETYISGGAIAQRAKQMSRGTKSFLSQFPENEITGELVADGAQQNDEICLEVFKITGYYLGVALVNIANIFNPQMIVIGGGAGEARELLLEPAREILAKRAIEPNRKGLVIVPAQLGGDAGVIGAASLVMHEMDRIK